MAEGEASRDVRSARAPAATGHKQLPDFGLAIGVDHYPRFRSLHGACDDAGRFHAWLCDADGGGIAPEHARLVVSTADPVAPLQDQVDDVLVDLLTAADRLGGGRRLYFYFSGHGAASPNEAGDDVALLLAKWSRTLARLALSADQYRARLTGVGLFQELAIFLDCCRTTASGAVGLPPTITFERTGERTPTRSFVAYATELGRSAFERPDDGAWQGVFTRCLLAILRRSPGRISAASLQEALEREVQDVGGSQRAHVVNGLSSDASFGKRQTPTQLQVVNILKSSSDRDKPPFVVGVDADVRVAIYDATDERILAGEGMVDHRLRRGRYRVRLERCGRIETHLVDHDTGTDLRSSGPLIDTPAPIPRAASYQPYYAAAAQHYSAVDTCSPIGAPSHTSRLCLLLRRADATSGPAQLPSEPITIHDLQGRFVTTLNPATCAVDARAGFIAFSARVAPGTYRVRAVRSRRDVAITIPAGRAAHVFVADGGEVRLDDLRVALRPIDQPFDPSSPVARAMESAIAALKDPTQALPSAARSLLPHALHDDLCFAIAVAHLSWRGGELAIFERIMEQLHPAIAELPDLVILDQLRGARRLVRRPELQAPPLLRASLGMTMTRSELDPTSIAPTQPIARAARTAFQDSIWCTFSDRAWDEQWIEPTIESLRVRSPDLGARAIARTVAIAPHTVAQTLENLDATLPLVLGQRARLEDIEIPGYSIDDVMGCGSQGTVFRSRRDLDGRIVAIKVVPLHGPRHHTERVQRELDLMRHLDHPAVLAINAWGALAENAGIWFETELCRGSLLDLVSEADAPLTPDRAVRMVLGALDGLAYLHDHGIVHRDIKPSNLLVRDDDRVVIADFGLAKSLAELSQLTGTGVGAGTVRFAAPEQLLDFKHARPTCDVWSMSATLYFLLTLELPRDEYADQTKSEAALENPIVPIADRRPDLPDALARCIDRALSIDVDLRPRDGGALRDELAAVFHGLPS